MSRIESRLSAPASRLVTAARPRAIFAWSVHALTASGVLVGMLSLVAVLNKDARTALLWLILAQVIDGVDGPIARRLQVDVVLPHLDGYILDLVVDYVTCVVVPAAFLYRFELVPPAMMLPCIAAVLFTSALWFSRTDMIDADHWFRGWPAVWNLAVPCMYLSGTRPAVNVAIVLVCSMLTLTNLPFVHPLQVTDRRPVTAIITVAWLAAMLTLTLKLPNRPTWDDGLLLGPPVYFFWLTWGRVRAQRSVEAAA